MIQPLEVFTRVKTDFCNLLDYKIRGDTLEVITGIPTLTGAVVSVFVSYQDGRYLVSDGGWLDQDAYEAGPAESAKVVSRFNDQFVSRFKVHLTENAEGVAFYYNTCSQIEQVSALVSDMGHFIASIINAQSLTNL